MYYTNVQNGPINRRESKRAAIALFLIGSFSITQVNLGFAIGISEIFVYLAAPWFFVKDLPRLRQHGMMVILGLGAAVNVMNIVSSLYNHIPTYFIFKGFASSYPLLAFPIVLHHYLEKDLSNLKWLLLGVCFTYVINIFAFQTSFELTTYGQGVSGLDAAEAIMSGPIFWISRLGNFIRVPIQGWYLNTPLTYSCLAPLFLAVFAMATSASGRAAALGSIGLMAIVLACGKKRSRMRKFGRNLASYIIIAVIGVFALDGIYRVAAMSGWLGEKALEKYEHQTRGSKSILKLLMGGRSEFFVGLLASFEKPLIGHGPWAFDNGEHTHEFLMKYGDEEDVERIAKENAYYHRLGVTPISYIPCHSHIVGFWLWWGVAGFVYWLYVLYAIFRYLHKESHVIPQWFGFLAAGAPTFLWHMFFSGFGFRIVTLPYVCALVIAHNVAIGRMKLPMNMELEAQKADRK